MSHHFDHYCSLVTNVGKETLYTIPTLKEEEEQEKRKSHAPWLLVLAIYFVYVRKQEDQKKKNKLIWAFFSIRKHYNLISITAPLICGRGKKPTESGGIFGACV